MKHLIPYKRINESLNLIDLQDFKGQIVNIIADIVSFDSSALSVNSSQLMSLYESDFELFKEFIFALANSYHMIEGDAKTDIKKIFFNKTLSYDYSNIVSHAALEPVLEQIIKSKDFDNFRDIAMAYVALIKHINTNYSDKTDEFRKAMPISINVALDNLNTFQLEYFAHILPDYPSSQIFEYYAKVPPYTAEELMSFKGNIDKTLSDAFNTTPAKLVLDLKTLKRLLIRDFDTFLELLSVLATSKFYFRPEYKRDRSAIESYKMMVSSYIQAIFHSVDHPTQYTTEKRKSIGPHMNRLVFYLLKQKRFEDVLKIGEILKRNERQFPFNTADYKHFDKEQIKELYDRGYIKLHKVDRERLLQDKDQYSVYTGTKAYKLLTTVFGLRDTSTEQVKLNGNLRMSDGNDEYTFYSYGTVRRPSASGVGKVLDPDGVDATTEKGAEQLLSLFASYLCKKESTEVKRGEYEDLVKIFLKDNPIKARTATIDEWLKWFTDLYEYSNGRIRSIHL